MLLKTEGFEEKKATFQRRKPFGPPFFPIIEDNKSQATFYKGPQGTLTYIKQLIRSFHWVLIGR